MIKSELVQRLAARNPHLYQRDVENIVDAILDEITAGLARGERVELRGFGAFSVKHRPARTGRNPRTGAHVSVQQKSVPKGLPVRDYSPGAGFAGLKLTSFAGNPLDALWRLATGESASVDGLVSVWQMSAGN